MVYAYKFTPALIERVWGGNALRRYGKPIPDAKRIGESWEISDRDDVQSVVANGPDAGKTLRQLIEGDSFEILGSNILRGSGVPAATGQHDSFRGGDAAPAKTEAMRFPLLVKLLDARERLSLQVHPPIDVARKLGGEPKTEMWYVLEADKDAHLIAGLRRGVKRADFLRALVQHPDAMKLEDCIYRFPVAAGDCFFVPSGRLHAIDAGVVLVEIQQNSDTTYRVYDWGRVGLDGKPRQLHVKESLASINFDDFEPAKQTPKAESNGANFFRRLVECDYFHVHQIDLNDAWPDECDGTTFQIITCVEGSLSVTPSNAEQVRLDLGEFALLPASLGSYTLVPQDGKARVLKAYVPGLK